MKPRTIVALAVVGVVLALSLLVAWRQFHGPATEATLVAADTGRQLARGAGFTTLVNYPQTSACLAARGVRFDPAKPYPELHQAPLYSLVIAAGLRVLPAGLRASLFASAPVPPDGFAADYFLLGLNLALFWLAAWLTFVLARRLFDALTGWLAAGALLVFTLSIDDYIITSFVAGPGATTLPLQIYSMVKTGVTPEINAVSTLLLVVTIGLIAAAQRLQTVKR